MVNAAKKQLYSLKTTLWQQSTSNCRPNIIQIHLFTYVYIGIFEFLGLNSTN